MLGIVRDKTLNATHAGFLNDPQELTFAETILRDFLRLRRSAFTDVAKSLFYEGLLDSLEGVRLSRELYVVSLSEANDLLSQWQSYSAHGYGYSVGFDGKSLRDIYGSPKVIYLRRVLYTEHEQQHCLNYMVRAVEDVIDSTFSPWRNSLRDPMGGFVRIVSELLEEFLVTFKHERSRMG